MTAEETFVLALEQCETGGIDRSWGDDGRACGAWQIHPGMYASWGPRPEDFGRQECSWRWAFCFAVRKFYRAARESDPGRDLTAIAMAFHLHGQVVWDGWDDAYAMRFERAVNSLAPAARG